MSSNDLTQVRDYVNTRMAVVEPDYNEWLGSLEDIGNIPQTKLDSTYHITLGTDSSSTQSDNFIEDNFSVTITTFKRGFNEPVEARDAAIQTANCIRLDLIKPLNIEAYKAANDGNIEDVVSVSITPSEIDLTNDNIIKIETELNVRLFIAT